ncbi:hypothetical protein GADJET_52 [Mycobacterium phage Gadjet]|uniref:GIY-YIG domain-containing protein n=1 Tax=Mycobacterium phage Gadjet TaxID=1089122 RepID=G8I3T2_9CAUD|nr:endonuclease [Mycobacterium phage Gadjet]AER47376.1 hypothetical protein GADJET_52 [Mycobacterium phage Gadjet]
MRDDLVLYRFFDAEGRLLYIGKSISVMSRLSSHASSSRFFRTAVKMTFQRGFSSHDELLAAEREAIEQERPAYNVCFAKRSPWNTHRRPKTSGTVNAVGWKPGWNRLADVRQWASPAGDGIDEVVRVYSRETGKLLSQGVVDEFYDDPGEDGECEPTLYIVGECAHLNFAASLHSVIADGGTDVYVRVPVSDDDPIIRAAWLAVMAAYENMAEA